MSDLIKHTPNHTVSIFLNKDMLENAQSSAKIIASSSLVPKEYQLETHKDNPDKAISNVVIALDMAHRMGEDPMLIMQNLNIIQGRPSFSSKYVIGKINASGRFADSLEFEISHLGKKRVEYIEYTGYGNQRSAVKKFIDIDDMSCVAYTRNKQGKKILSPKVTIEMAVKEGWYTKPGSKWPTMPEVMIQYRAGSFFSSFYCPDITLGIRTTEEIQDIEYTAVETVTPVNNVIEKLNSSVAVADPVIVPVAEPIQVVTEDGDSEASAEIKPETTSDKPKPKDEDLI